MSSDSCKDDASTKSDVCSEVNDMLQNMNTTDDKEVIISVCANCGKEGSDVMNTCNKCNSVKYCNAICKKKHRTKHKKQCERRVAELHDEALFKQPPQKEDCPICFLRMPPTNSAHVYMACCGKVICRGCVFAVALIDLSNQPCPFCRTPAPCGAREMLEKYTKRMGINDSIAIRNVGNFYADGSHGYPQNYVKALELYHRAAELGNMTAYYNLGHAYSDGNGVERNEKKSQHYFELAAIKGDENTRFCLGNLELKVGNIDRAFKHYMIAIQGGKKTALEGIKYLYSNGYATKGDYSEALQTYQAYLDEVKSGQRDESAAFNADWKYID